MKRLRAIRREIVEKEAFTLTRDDAKSAAIEAALAAPKLPVRQPPPSPFMEVAAPTPESASASGTIANDMGMFDFNCNCSMLNLNLYRLMEPLFGFCSLCLNLLKVLLVV